MFHSKKNWVRKTKYLLRRVRIQRVQIGGSCNKKLISLYVTYFLTIGVTFSLIMLDSVVFLATVGCDEMMLSLEFFFYLREFNVM